MLSLIRCIKTDDAFTEEPCRRGQCVGAPTNEIQTTILPLLLFYPTNILQDTRTVDNDRHSLGFFAFLIGFGI